jgi:hypothetical protein
MLSSAREYYYALILPKLDIVLVAIMMALTQTDTDWVTTPLHAALKRTLLRQRRGF